MSARNFGGGRMTGLSSNRVDECFARFTMTLLLQHRLQGRRQLLMFGVS